MSTGVRLFGVFLAASIAVAPATVAAVVPAGVAVQGVIRSGGGAVADGTYAMQLTLHDAATGGKTLWSSGPLSLKVAGGAFWHVMGTNKPLGDALSKAGKNGLWLGVQVGVNPQMKRARVHATPFARRAAVAESLQCSGCLGKGAIAAGAVGPSHVSFAYAGAADGIKGGAAKTAKALSCTGCVTNTHLKFTGDLDVGKYAIKAAKLTVSGDVVAGGVVAAKQFLGDGSKLSGIKIPSGACSKKGHVVRGIKPDGSLDCVAALDPSALPGDGLDEISGGLLTNQFEDTWANTKAAPIPDNNPGGASVTIDVPDRGIAQALVVSADVATSSTGQIAVSVTDPKGKTHVLHSKSGSAKSLKGSWPKPNKLVSGDLGAWVGQNPKGKWTLKVVDNKFLNNKTDGAINSFAVTVKTQSNKKVAAKGGFQFQVAAEPPVPCDKTHIGLSYVGDKGDALWICNGEEYAPVFLSPLGTKKNPAASCLDIRTRHPGAKSGVYFVTAGNGSAQVHCDMDSYGGGWTAMARVAGKTWEYNSAYWTNASTLNPSKSAPAWDNAKFGTFNHMPVKELLLKAKSGKWTVVKLAATGKTLRQWFQGGTSLLTYVAGAKHPLELVDGRNTGFCQPPWRINTKGANKAWIRLGGWSNKHWNCGYGNDGAGKPTGAHLIGFGLRDDQWGPFTHNRKSFGVRDAHDSKYLGQAESAAMIYAR